MPSALLVVVGVAMLRCTFMAQSAGQRGIRGKHFYPKAIRSIAGGSGELVPPTGCGAAPHEKRGVAGPAIEAPQRG